MTNCLTARHPELEQHDATPFRSSVLQTIRGGNQASTTSTDNCNEINACTKLSHQRTKPYSGMAVVRVFDMDTHLPSSADGGRSSLGATFEAKPQSIQTTKDSFRFVSDHEVEPQERLTVWLQLKRVCIGVVGLVATLWSAYTTYKVLTEQGSQHYWLLILTTAAFFIGFWMIRIAVRGRSQEVRDVLF